MFFPILVLSALLPTLALSLATRQISGVCLTQQQANVVANNYAGLFTKYSNAYANSVLTSNFQDESDSVDWLINNGTNCPIPFGSVTFPTLAAFEKGSSGQPDIPFQVENVYVACSNVIVRWYSAMSPEVVRGIAILSTTFVPNPLQPFLINHIYSEFNSGAWGVNVGICKGVVAGSPSAC